MMHLSTPILAGLVGRLLLSDALVWRHHKIGLLQAYVAEADAPGDTEMRIHVWHPSLMLSDEDSGVMHDHRFRLTSHVLLGAMHDTEIWPYPISQQDWLNPQPGGLYRVWNIQNARSAEKEGGHWVRLEDKENYSIVTSEHVYSEGSTYSYPPERFHRSFVRKLTVTVCTKKEQRDVPARLLAKLGTTPKHAFDPGAGHGKIFEDHQDLLREASSRLLFIARNG